MKKLFALTLAVLMTAMSLVSCNVVSTKVDGEIELKEEIVKEPEKIAVSSFEELLEKMTEAEKKLESLSANVKCTVDITALEESYASETDVDMQIDIKNMISHSVVSNLTSDSDEPTVTESYSDETASYIKDITDEWFKHSTDPEEAQKNKELLESIENLEFDITKYVSDGQYSETTYGEKECYKLSYKFDLKLFEMLKEFGLEEELSEFKTELAEELGPEVAEPIYEMLSDLGTIEVVEYVDVYSLYPVAAEIDLTSLAQQLCDKLINTVAMAIGEGFTAEDLGALIVVNNLYVSMTADGFNETEVVIPEEVLSAPEFTDAYLGEDIYFEEEYYDIA